MPVLCSQRTRQSIARAIAAATLACACACPAQTENWVAGDLITINDDGGWCWFEGERAIVHDGELLVGSVAAGTHDLGRRGNIEITRVNLRSRDIDRVVLHRQLEMDDHNSPALLALDDDHLLAVWAKHGPEDHFYYAKTEKTSDTSSWERIQDYSPSPTSRITYSNTFQLADEDGRIYDFFRGLDGKWKPSYVYSDDRGKTWTRGNIIINVPTEQNHRPYVRYASDNRSRIHLLYTEGHPRNYDNSVFHIYYENGLLYRSNGSAIGPMQDGIASPDAGTQVYEGDADHVAWVMDMRLDRRGSPVGLFSVQVDCADLSPRRHGEDHRYYYAKLVNGGWEYHEIAYAGSRLYKGEDDYTGLGVIDPNDPNVVYISTDADPVSGHALVSKADNLRHYEIYKGKTSNGGLHWDWRPITRDSTRDNIRPICPPSDEGTILIWLRGEYHTYTDFDQDVVGLIDWDE